MTLNEKLMTASTEVKDLNVLYYFIVQLVITMCFGYCGDCQDQLRLVFGSPLYLMICLLVSQVMSFALIWGIEQLKQNGSSMSILPIKTEHSGDGFLDSPEDITNRAHAGNIIPEPANQSIDYAPYDPPGSFFSGGEINYAERVKFKIDFDRSHPGFFERQKIQYDYLTNNEMWLLAYLHLKLSTREIAVLLNIDPASVRRAKTRLYKKMALSEDE